MSKNNEVIIKTENLTKRFGQTVAVDSLDFDIRKGEIFGASMPEPGSEFYILLIYMSFLFPSAPRSAGFMPVQKTRLTLRVNARLGLLNTASLRYRAGAATSSFAEIDSNGSAPA